jgi:hypothetical protein
VSALVVSCYSTVCQGYCLPRRLSFVRRNNGFGLRPEASWSRPQYCSSAGRPPQFDELSTGEFRRETAETWPASVADMLLDAWRATLDHPAFVTSAIQEILGSPPGSFSQWAADNAAAFAKCGLASDRTAG